MATSYGFNRNTSYEKMNDKNAMYRCIARTMFRTERVRKLHVERLSCEDYPERSKLWIWLNFMGLIETWDMIK